MRFAMVGLFAWGCAGDGGTDPKTSTSGPDQGDADTDADADADVDADADADADSDADADPPSAACDPWPSSTGSVVTAVPADVGSLQSLVDGLSPGDTLSLGAGNYDLNGGYLWITGDGVTIRGATGDPADVVLDGGYATTSAINIVGADDVVIADLTVQRVFNHPIHVTGGSSPGDDALNPVIYNVRLIDPGEQAIKINTGANFQSYADDGLVACSHIELTSAGRSQIRNNCYTGGIDAHQSRGWVVRDNHIEGFWCDQGLSEHGIHFWRGNRDTLIERNVVVDCARGIGLGLLDCCSGDGRTFGDDPCPGAGGAYVDDWGGTIRNNVVYAQDGGLFASASGFDSGVALAAACNAVVAHNTVLSTAAPFNSMEWRFSVTDAEFSNNLVSHVIMDRGGAAVLAGNVQGAALTSVVNAAGGDFHLDAGASVAIDQGVALAAGVCDEDLDGDLRDATPDVGADEVP